MSVDVLKDILTFNGLLIATLAILSTKEKDSKLMEFYLALTLLSSILILLVLVTAAQTSQRFVSAISAFYEIGVLILSFVILFLTGYMLKNAVSYFRTL